MYTPKVSIITVVFNGERHLEQTILSILNQSYPHIQYIVIDGGSSDGTLSIIKKYEDRIDYWISEKDRGISDAFNKGIARCEGEVIGILNADDWYEPEAVVLAVKHIEPVDVVFGNIQLWRNDKKEAIVLGNSGLLKWEMTLNHPSVFLKKRCYDVFGGFDLQYRCAMDYDLLLRLKVNHCRFAFVPEVVANMRWGGVSDKRWKLGCRETLEIKNKYLPQKKLWNELYYWKHVFAIRSNKLFTKWNMIFIIRLYRKVFSPMKKIQ